MVIGAGHTIMAGYIPKSIPATEFSEKFYEWTKPTPDTIKQFGLFGSDINYNTYYPNLTEDELKPKDEEFIEPMFRLLSATIVSKNWNPTDFGQPGILRDSMNLLLGQTVNCDHETNIGNAIGSVSKVVWQEAYKDGNFVIPAGINGVLKIDGKANPRIARGILMEPPSIHSNSVTVQFRWDKSHPKMDDNEFYQKLGTYDEKGVMVRRMVTEVVRYLETSLVSHGADTFAQKIGNDGKIINPNFAKRTWSSYSEYMGDTSKQYYFQDYKSDFEEYTENNDTKLNNNITTNNQEKENMTLEEFIAKLFGADMLQLEEGQSASEEVALTAVRDLVANNGSLLTQVNNLKTEKTALSEKVVNLEAKVANLQDMAGVGTKYIASLRDKVVANYKKLKGDAADESIVTMLNADTTGILTLQSLNKEYETQLEEKFPLTCSKCGSHDVSRGSSVKDDTTKNDEGSKDEVPSVAGVLQHLYESKMK
jgi:hypothetical protein